MHSDDLRVVGKPEARKDGWDKVTGRALFVDDIPLKDFWYGGVLRSNVANGKLLDIRKGEGFDWSRVVVITAADLPGPNMVVAVRKDCPILAEKRVAYVTEPVALVAAPDRETLKEALASLEAVIEPDVEPVLDIEKAINGDTVIWGDDNIIQTFDIERGNIEEGFDEADVIVEGRYSTGYQEQVYLEPQGVYVVPAEDGRGVEINISCQCPFYIHNAVVQGLGFEPDRVVIKQAVTGGGFGGKEFYPSLIALQASVMALASGKTVKMIFDREEDLSSSSKRHPSVTRIRSGHKNDGTITAMDVDLILNGGATTTLSVVVLQRGVLHATGCYKVPNVKIRGRSVATNLPPCGGYRGFGVPQALFALERHMDRIAQVLKLDPVSVRKKNLIKTDDTLPCGQVLKQAAAEEVLDRVLEMSHYQEKVQLYSDHNRSGAKTLKGIGLSLFLHGGAFTGSGEDRIDGKTKIVFIPGETTKDSRFEIRVSSTEMGQGSSTVLSQIVAESLGVPFGRINYMAPDTSQVPDSGPTVASRTTVIVGAILTRSAEDIISKISNFLFSCMGEQKVTYRKGLFRAGEESISMIDAAWEYSKQSEELVGWGAYQSTGSHWDDEKSRGDAYPSYSWACDVVEVDVDGDTFEVVPTRLYAAVEIGTVINPVLAEGQFEGGSLQALGYGWLEDMKVKKDRIDAGSMSKYLIPTTMDTPDFEIEFIECPYEHGPYGAKGLGELPHDGAAPALASAIGNALGIFPSDIPVTPERIVDMISKGAQSYEN